MINFLAFIGLCAIMVFCALGAYCFAPRIIRYVLKWWAKQGGNAGGFLLVSLVLVLLVGALIISAK